MGYRDAGVHMFQSMYRIVRSAVPEGGMGSDAGHWCKSCQGRLLSLTFCSQ